MDVRTEIKSALPRRSSTFLIDQLLEDENEEKDEKKNSISLEIRSSERKTYGSTESKSHVKVYIWKPVYSKEIRKRCCNETNISKSGHVSMELFNDKGKLIPYDEKNRQYGYISFYPPREEGKQFVTVQVPLQLKPPLTIHFL